MDAVRGNPIASATLTITQKDDRSDTLLTAPSAVADDQGIISSPSLQSPVVVSIVRAAGYLPAVLKEPPVGSVVALEAAAALRIVVLDPLGRPVPEARVVITADGTTTDFLGSADLPSGIGHPLAHRPRWCGTTDGNGQLSFEELPSSRLFLNVMHPLWVPLHELGANSPLQLAPGLMQLTITVDSMHGVVFRVPDEARAISTVFLAPFEMLDLQPSTTSRIAASRDWLSQRHPGGLVYVHRVLRPGDDSVRVRCQVLDDRGRRWLGQAPLQPLSDVLAPVFLEEDNRPARDITIILQDKNGTAFSGIPIVLASAADSVHSETGQSVTVPYGRYQVSPKALSRALWSVFRDLTIEVGADGPGRFVLETEEPLVEIVVHPRLPSGIVRSPVSFYFANEHGQGPAVVNWVPGRGPIRRVLAAEEISIKVRSVAYKDVDIPLRKVAYGTPSEIDVVLEEKDVR